MDVFALRNRLIDDYGDYVRSFIQIRDERIRAQVEVALVGGLLWPEPLIQLNPNFAPGDSVDELVDSGVLHPECTRIFQVGKDAAGGAGEPLRLHRHQADAIRASGLLDFVRTVWPFSSARWIREDDEVYWFAAELLDEVPRETLSRVIEAERKRVLAQTTGDGR